MLINQPLHHHRWHATTCVAHTSSRGNRNRAACLPAIPIVSRRSLRHPTRPAEYGQRACLSPPRGGKVWCQRDNDNATKEGEAGLLNKSTLSLLAGGLALLIALAITSNREDIADAIYDEGLRGSGDTLGAVLWSISLYFSSPWQLLLIFLGRVDTERPSDWLLSMLAKASGLNPREKNFSYPLALRATTVLICAVGGTLLASVLSAALGDATWSVSTGLGSCLIGGVYEVGRPDRLTVQEADHLEEQYQDFVKFAEERLQPRGSCHETEIFTAFRRSNARYREEKSLPDSQLRRFIRNWAKQYIYPTAERTGNGYFKRISLKESIDPFTGARTGMSDSRAT